MSSSVDRSDNAASVVCNRSSEPVVMQSHDKPVSISLQSAIYLDIITQLFSYQAQALITVRGVAKGSCRLRA